MCNAIVYCIYVRLASPLTDQTCSCQTPNDNIPCQSLQPIAPPPPLLPLPPAPKKHQTWPKPNPMSDLPYGSPSPAAPPFGKGLAIGDKVGGKIPRALRRLGSTPSLNNIEYTRMRHLKIFSPEGPRENVFPGPAVALDGPE